MTESNKSFTEKLIEQDAGISPTSLLEQRMKIEMTVESLNQKALSSQRFTIRAIAAVIVCNMFGLAISGRPIPYANVVFPILSICTMAAMVTAAVAIIRYWTIHRPMLEKGRIDLQVTMFRELQRQISELQKEK